MTKANKKQQLEYLMQCKSQLEAEVNKAYNHMRTYDECQLIAREDGDDEADKGYGELFKKASKRYSKKLDQLFEVKKNINALKKELGYPVETPKTHIGCWWIKK